MLGFLKQFILKGIYRIYYLTFALKMVIYKRKLKKNTLNASDNTLLNKMVKIFQLKCLEFGFRKFYLF